MRPKEQYNSLKLVFAQYLSVGNLTVTMSILRPASLLLWASTIRGDVFSFVKSILPPEWILIVLLVLGWRWWKGRVGCRYNSTRRGQGAVVQTKRDGRLGRGVGDIERLGEWGRLGEDGRRMRGSW